MALETATYIHDLVTSNPVETDSTGQGADHLRLIKSALQATFPNFTSAALNSTQAGIDAAVAAVAGTSTGVLNAGTVGAPGLALAGSLTTGLYSALADTLSVAIKGANALTIGADKKLSLAGALAVAGILGFSDGSAAAPALAFISDPTRGLYATTSGGLGVSVAGMKVGEFLSTGFNGAVAATTLAASGQITTTGGEASSNTTTGDIVVAGGVGVGGAIFAGSGIHTAGGVAATGDIVSSAAVTAATGLTVSAGPVTLPAGSIADAALASGAPKFTKEFVSSVTTYAFNQATAFAHGLGVKPKFVQACLYCATADIGYSVGDEVDLDGIDYVATGGAFVPLVHVIKDATNVTLAVENSPMSSVRMVRKDTAAVASATDGSWKFIVRAWA